MTEPQNPPRLLAVGKIGPAIGLKGEVYVQPWTDSPEERFAPGSVLSTEPGERGPLTVAEFRAHGKRFVIRFDGYDGRTQAESLRDTELLIAASARPVLEDPDDFYDTDLIGLAAVTPAGLALGAIKDVVHAPGSEYLVLLHEEREVLVPFVAEIVPTVDVAAGRVIVDPPEGLLEL
ncbi:16S rRNA processing protein RimM [Jatrophihabitans sp. GAS493]|uniref:ribosome maturation factor RimM n=1 Tax=Jatrophihabitans sp. GAS493 TaxID=1907575 RepID=UPI000BC03259|nr:ribosome maturation factor RimM [Jatrophihabitans sp. GAS493]SOD74205.1 16S rRNA processing protein RimM [Jatrophihabitans sp. GAS493]